MKFNCKQCGKVGEARACRIRSGVGGKFCSYECAGKWRSANQSGKDSPLYSRVQVGCEVCGILVEVKKCHSHKRAYCSKKCSSKWKKEVYVGEMNPFFGRRLSDEAKKKLSEASKRINSGSGNPFWTGGGIDYWKRMCLERDSHTCQVCGLRDPEIMHVDHIKPKHLHPELFLELTNMRCICPNCHQRKSNKERSKANRKRHREPKVSDFSVVTKDIPSGETWCGNPARRMNQ